MAKPIAFTDLDRLLVATGFTCERPAHTHTLYTHSPTGKVVLLPAWQPGDVALPHHLVAVRRFLVDWGILDEEEFERWLCTVGFGTDCREPAAAGARNAATG